MGEHKRHKVAVLGAGIAGLTAALELTATQELRDRYEVTVYQLGWRCGGKCATGRSKKYGWRVEEHGLHLWFGGYDNAFRLLKRCYDELDRPADHPLATMDQAWSPLSSVVMYDWYKNYWSADLRTFSVEPGRPWDDVPVPRFWDLLAELLDGIDGHLVRLRKQRRVEPLTDDAVGPLDLAARRAGNLMEKAIVHAAGAVVEWHRRHDSRKRRHTHPVAAVLSGLRSWIWRHHVRGRMDDDDVRHTWSHTDMSLTVLIGMIRDEVLWKGFGAINDIDFRAWLSKHGARPTTLDGPDVRVVYDESFADGTGPAITDTGADRFQRRSASFAAGAALYGMVRTQLPYRGSVMWQARAGMGDTAIAPMYECLAARGVDVRFFQQVAHLGVDAAAGTVDRIDIVQQARPDGPYDPLVDVKGLRCWPSQPNWDQLVDGDRLGDVVFEFGQAEPGATTETLRLGDDFDTVVLAISAAALPEMCQEVIDASPAFATMLDHTYTTMTQAFQLWLTTPPSELGFDYPHSATTSFIEPVDTAADNSQLLWSEDWPADHTPASVWYFCGRLPDAEGDDLEQVDDRARTAAFEYLDAIGKQWPGAMDGDDFRWDLLVAPPDVHGTDRFHRQFWRANATPTERYVQTPPGTVKYRLGPDESGLHNLILAGDWTRNGMDIGAVEAAVMSGMAAARAICGSPATIAWERQAWMVDG